MHVVHAAKRVMAARQRARNTSPAKMAIFEMRNRRAVYAHTPHASIPAAWLYTTTPRTTFHVISYLKKTGNLQRFFPYSLERKKNTFRNCFLASRPPPPSRMTSRRYGYASENTCVASRENSEKAMREQNFRDASFFYWKPETMARDES